MTDHRPAAAKLRERLDGRTPQVALVLGSGFNTLITRLDDPLTLSYRDLPGFPLPTVAGHSGQLLIGDWAGVSVACLQGRAHSYEGHPASAIAVPIRTLHAIGCQRLLLTNAAGSLRRDMGPGSLMLITDHINWAGINPLVGPNDETLGPRFIDMSRAYDPLLQGILRDAATEAAVPLYEGVYLMCQGPNFETPAEIRAFAVLGADAVGMSTVPECLVANHCGMHVAAVSGITNLAAGLAAHPLSHEDTLAEGRLLADKLDRLLTCFLNRIAL